MKPSLTLATLAIGLIAGSANLAHAGAPQPDTRAGDFVHVCAGGANKGQACTVATQDTDCPKSACVVETLSKSIKGTLTIIAHDTVTDWATGNSGNQALTVMLEVKAPDGSAQILSASYQDLVTPTNAPAALSNVVAIGMDEAALKTLAPAVGGLLFVQPESALSTQLQTLFSITGTPVLTAVKDRQVDFADHTGDPLASVLRFKVKIQFVTAL